MAFEIDIELRLNIYVDIYLGVFENIDGELCFGDLNYEI